jgi:hypothetical protein
MKTPEEQARHKEAEDGGEATATCRRQRTHALGQRVPHRLQAGSSSVSGRPRTAPAHRRSESQGAPNAAHEARAQRLHPVLQSLLARKLGMPPQTTMATEE